MTRYRNHSPLATSDDESLCRRCGRCCFHKLIVGPHVVSLDDPCQHLDPNTHLCAVYERRFEVNPGCLSVAKGIDMHVFPEDCPYVADLPDYAGPLYGLSSQEIIELIECHEENTC